MVKYRQSHQDQLFWTRKFSEFVSIIDRNSLNIDLLRQEWWFNPLHADSLRLSRLGYSFVTTRVDLQAYSHLLDSKIMPKTLLQLEKFLDYPYYIYNLKNLIVFDEATSITLTLYGNDLQTYLDNVQKSI